ncbi:NAD(+) synthase [Salegentibacter salegens]|uniref:NH(3)-dependent NAD(+) synthetase n=1 Tax=Salegentibacter salegens TaxID=143223 RepID=A0A1M7I0Y8_9FLAO|nr:NAD(+) synthase [Salegentibacter salegens]PRX45288.1 NAD+ synthase [Salegentibacter salegens]SHM34318.1 NAD+ synthase [Salegentibacter salegens]
MQTEKVVDHIVNWLKEYATNAQMNGFVLGVSGGIDSAVTSALCAKTGLRTLCIEMPIHQHTDQVTRAQKHIDWLKQHYANVTNLEVNLTPVFDEFKKTAPQVEASGTLDLTLANTRARLRMSTLYYFAGLHNYLVAGTGNKVEDFGVGFYTKYGDGGVDLSPIADLMKTEVTEIAKFLGIVPEIVSAAPTDGLFGDSRTDEDQIGASYPELEWAMKEAENGKTAEDFEGRKQEVFKIYKSKHAANLHKMKPIPVCNIPVSLKN